MVKAVVLTLLLALALWLRLWGLGFGTPIWSNLYIRPDETLLVVHAVELFARHGNPGHLDYPALLIQALGVWFQLVHAGSSLLVSAPVSILEDFGRNPSRYFVAGRIVSAFCGVLSAVVVLRLAKRWCSDLHAGIAAAWYAVSTLAVREAHFAVTDTALSLLVACTVLAAVRYFEADGSRRRRAILWCGCLCGMSLATKYVAGILVPALVFAILAGGNSPRRSERIQDILLFLATSIGLFLVLNPWLLLHPGPFLERMKGLFQAIYHSRPRAFIGAESPHGLQRASIYLGLLPGRWVGVAFAVLGLAEGLARYGRERNGQLTAFLAVTLAYAAMLVPASTLPFRYLAPLLPLVAVMAAIGLEASVRALRRVPKASLIVGLMGLATTLPATVRMDASLAKEDTRAEAGRWINEHVPDSVPIVWLGEPESEPQWHESTTSMRRRIQYAEQRYGLVAARVIDRPYLLLMHAPSALGTGGHEVYRNPKPEDIRHSRLCVVQAEYPLPMVTSDPRELQTWMHGHTASQVVIGPSMEGRGYLLDRTDAWFLPMNLQEAMQPGPRLTIYIVDRDDL